MRIKQEIIDDQILRISKDGITFFEKNLRNRKTEILNTQLYNEFWSGNLNLSRHDFDDGEGCIYVKSKINLKTTSEGGRTSGFKTAYRPNHVFEYFEDNCLRTFIGEVNFEAQELIMPGTTAEVVVRFLFLSPLEKYLEIGRKWWIHEGSKIVAEAEILSVETK
jgi:hypothetical protein